MSSRSVGLGLSDPATNLLLPLEVEWDSQRLNVNVDGGLLVEAGSDTGWIGGLALGHKVGNVELLAEIHGEGTSRSDASNWVAQLGLRRDFNKESTLLFAFGRTIRETNSEPLIWTSYLGIQLHF